MQPLTVHITPLDDDYVAPATNPILDKQLNKFGEEFSNITRAAKKANDNPVKDVKELSDINTYDCETFIRKLLHQVPAARSYLSPWFREMVQRLARTLMIYHFDHGRPSRIITLDTVYLKWGDVLFMLKE
ncbi:hypothetical protein Tco_0111714 [Tanacetum coccineum]